MKCIFLTYHSVWSSISICQMLKKWPLFLFNSLCNTIQFVYIIMYDGKIVEFIQNNILSNISSLKTEIREIKELTYCILSRKTAVISTKCQV